MSTKRKVINRTQPPGGGGRITPRAVELYRQVRELERNFDTNPGPYRHARAALETELRLEPWDWSPFEVETKAPDWVANDITKLDGWNCALDLLRQLKRAAAAA